MCVGTLSGVTSAGMVISSARGGTCSGRGVRAARGPGPAPGAAAARASHLRGELLAHERQDQRRLSHLGCAGRRGQRIGHGRRAPAPAPRPPPGSPARRLPSPRSKMRTSRFMAAERARPRPPPRPQPQPRPRPGSRPQSQSQPAIPRPPALPAPHPHFRPPARRAARTNRAGQSVPVVRQRHRADTLGIAGPPGPLLHGEQEVKAFGGGHDQAWSDQQTIRQNATPTFI